jgi:glycosyltransferase involved in cell wall biosynthesis
MTVVHVCKVKGIAGAERHLLVLLPALQARGLDVRMLVIDDPIRSATGFIDALAARGIGVERLESPRHLDPTLTVRFARRFRAIGPDLVHTHLFHADLYALPAARRAQVPAAVSSRHDNNPFRRRRAARWATRRAMRHASRVVAISRAVGRFVVDVEGVPAAKVDVVPYGLPTRRDVPAPIDGAPPGWPADGPVVLVVGRLSDQKGVDVLIDAWPDVRARHARATLVVAGDGPRRGVLGERAARLGVSGSVHFAGWIPAAGAVMQRADVVVVPSRWEGFGLVALEAMAASRPVVASRVDALPEIVVDRETGLLVPAGDPGALAAALCELLDRPAWAASLGATGEVRLAGAFSVDAMVDATLGTYERSLAGSRSP